MQVLDIEITQTGMKFDVMLNGKKWICVESFIDNTPEDESFDLLIENYRFDKVFTKYGFHTQEECYLYMMKKINESRDHYKNINN